MPSAKLAPDVEVRELLPAGWHYILPRRDLGQGRWAGVIFFIIGTIMIVFGMLWLLSLLLKENVGWVGSLATGVFAVPLLSGGMALLALGCFMLFGQSEIVLNETHMATIERAGLLRWTRKQSLAEITRLEVVAALSSQQHRQPDVKVPLADRCRIQAGKLFLAPGYSRELCLALAESLRQRWPKNSAGVAVVERPIVVDQSPEAIAQREALEIPVQPPDSLVQVDDTPAALTLRVPPAGIRKGSKGLFVMAIFWNAFMVLFTSLFLFAGPAKEEQAWIFLLFIIPFWAVGIGLMLGAINMGRREAAIVVAGEQLLIVQKGIFGTKHREWRRDEVKDIAYAASGMEMNDVPIMEFQVRPARGRKFGVLAGRSDDELQWLALLVRQRLFGPTPIREPLT